MMTLIAEGATAQVYRWGEGQVVKLLKPGYPPEMLMQEARKTRAAHEAGLPAPAVGRRVEVDSRPGWLFEEVAGVPLTQATDDINAQAELMTRLHAQLHGTATRALPDLRLRLRQQIRAAPLDGTLRRRALTLLEHLPDGDSFCHGDLHPGNIMVNGRAVLIDWNEATRGHALADVARTLVILGGQGQSPLLAAYLKAYCALTRASREAIMPWVLPVAAARLAEGHDEQHAYLTGLAAGHPLV
jgi:Ser/Thr protein kinase RdoA (MazF antagonist)